MVNTHGLATSIRSAQASETFDLGGQNVSTITTTIESAFKEPFDHDNFANEAGGMIRLTFVTGAGKQARAKYDDGAAKAVTSTLTTLGYVEDRGASCVLECAGTFKQQHDTGKNLKTVVVFPKVVSHDGNKTSESSQLDPIISEDSPGYKIATAPMSIFENMIQSKCPSWSDQRGCLTALEALQSILNSLEEKLMNGTPLDDAEQKYFDSVVALDGKIAHVKQQLQELVEGGKVTSYEKERLLEQVKERIAALEKEKKPTTKAIQRRKLLESIQPIDPHLLAHQKDIIKLRQELEPLLKLEASASGRLLTIKETQTLARKDEIMEEISYLEEASQGWFEDDDAFQSRLKFCRSKIKVTSNNKAKKPAKGAGQNSWVSSGGSSTQAWKQRPASKPSTKSAKPQAGNVFSAMMADDSDDSD